MKSSIDLLKEYRDLIEGRVSVSEDETPQEISPRADLDNFMTKWGFVKIDDPLHHKLQSYVKRSVFLKVMIDDEDDFWTIEDVNSEGEYLEDGIGVESLKQTVMKLIRAAKGLRESTNNIVKGSWIPRHDEGQLTWKDRDGIYLVLPGSNSAYGSNDGGFSSVEDAEEFNQKELGGKWKVQVNGEPPQHGKFNTCSECDGKGCPECEFTGKYDVGVNSEHYL